MAFSLSENINGTVCETLSELVNCGRLSHAVVLEGGEAGERMALAREIAASLVCTSAGERPCGECSHCVKARSMSHPDIAVISGGESARSFSVDKIREIKRDAVIVPNEAARKVYILQNAGSMSESAQNALLKIFEEPPQYVSFILECGSKSALLQTVLSRASVFSLGEEKGGSADAEKLEKARKAALEILRALYSHSELQLLRASAPLEKDKELLRLCLPELSALLTSALRSKYGASDGCSQAVLTAGESITGDRLLHHIGVISDCRAAAERNANHNLLITRLCAELSAV